MLHLSSWMTTLPMMLIGMTGILLVIGFLVLVVMALNCLILLMCGWGWR